MMEYLDGETLAERVKKGPMPLKQALEYGIQIAQASVIHTGPESCIAIESAERHVDRERSEVARFWPGQDRARARNKFCGQRHDAFDSDDDDCGTDSPAQPLTRQGTVVGTFQYMAPETLQACEADERSDIFSLGCVLYEMVTGRRAFDGKSQLSVMTGILEKDPEPVSRIRGIAGCSGSLGQELSREKSAGADPDSARRETAVEVDCGGRWHKFESVCRRNVRGSGGPWPGWHCWWRRERRRRI